MIEYDAKLVWPLKQKPILAFANLFERERFNSLVFELSQMKQGYYLIFWDIENNETVWRDCRTKHEFFEVELIKWWDLQF